MEPGEDDLDEMDLPQGGRLVTGNPPWMREGVDAKYGPDTTEAQQKANKLRTRVKEQQEAARDLVRQRREIMAAELESERLAGLQSTAKRFFVIGCFALPWIHVIMWIYFWPEWKDPNASSEVKRYLKLSLVPIAFWTIIMLIWFIAFQAMASTLAPLNILSIGEVYF
eukprot:Plantae.Rhodophyta-Purpureofilum_apyrenoidigerum.ctg2700.p1 GENE.Plantae.Rhodophyta-Purpureofilum_apyrenoidigerum.ctg2700~~Plantae.Rhodophyta-Purpureofilum_apyrenoidigerum.ctg2700.p1  ORF type:complete len:187 (+),score=29.64 Plantae.Rhodophyta-Purpureofilum_apyrenoidigerum.ctg2700:58-561(+)